MTIEKKQYQARVNFLKNKLEKHALCDEVVIEGRKVSIYYDMMARQHIDEINFQETGKSPMGFKYDKKPTGLSLMLAFDKLNTMQEKVNKLKQLEKQK